MPTVLDDVKKMGKIDKEGMLDAIRGMPSDLESALDAVITAELDCNRAVICGMGGSAIGGDILSDAADRMGCMPVSVTRGTSLPNWADKCTLAVMISYSGNTRETLMMYDDAKAKGCTVVGITSGGELGKRCRENNDPMITVTGGVQPRAALGLLLGSAAVVLDHAGAMPIVISIQNGLEELRDLSRSIAPDIPVADNIAKQAALSLNCTVPIIYCPGHMRSVALRWQTQINENSKMLALSGESPEMNHNHIVGWMETSLINDCQPVFIEDGSGSWEGRIQDVSVSLMNDAELEPLVISPGGETPCGRLLRGIHLGDMVSYYLAMLKGVDPTPVESIGTLKERLGILFDRDGSH